MKVHGWSPLWETSRRPKPRSRPKYGIQRLGAQRTVWVTPSTSTDNLGYPPGGIGNRALPYSPHPGPHFCVAKIYHRPASNPSPSAPVVRRNSIRHLRWSFVTLLRPGRSRIWVELAVVNLSDSKGVQDARNFDERQPRECTERQLTESPNLSATDRQAKRQHSNVVHRPNAKSHGDCTAR